MEMKMDSSILNIAGKRLLGNPQIKIDRIYYQNLFARVRFLQKSNSQIKIDKKYY